MNPFVFGVTVFLTNILDLFQESQWQELLVSLHTLPIPEPGVPVHLGVVSQISQHDTQLSSDDDTADSRGEAESWVVAGC